MRRAALILLLLAAGWALPCAAQIHAVAGTYGSNIPGVPRGNVTAHLVATCDGKMTCSFGPLDVMYADFGIGDPAPYQYKDYLAEWFCTGDPMPRTMTTRAIVTLSCAAPVPTPTPLPTPTPGGTPASRYQVIFSCKPTSYPAPPNPNCTTQGWTLILTTDPGPNLTVKIVPVP